MDFPDLSGPLDEAQARLLALGRRVGDEEAIARMLETELEALLERRRPRLAAGWPPEPAVWAARIDVHRGVIRDLARRIESERGASGLAERVEIPLARAEAGTVQALESAVTGHEAIVLDRGADHLAVLAAQDRAIAELEAAAA